MKVFIDTVCPACADQQLDVFVERGGDKPLCSCGARVERLWLSAPGITPQGTRPERRVAEAPREKRVDVKAIAAETKAEVEQKWLRYSDEQVAEQHVSREINHAAGMADELGNLTPLPTPEPITFAKPAEAYA